MKTSQSIQLLDTNDTNISPIVGVESIFYEQAENNKRKTLSDKLLLSGKDGSLSINTVSYDDASDKNIIVNLSTSKLDGADGSLFKLDVTQVSMTDFMGVIEEMIEEGGGGGGELGPVNASIRDISNRLANVSDNVDTIGQSVDELDDEYNELNTSFGILDTSVGKLWDSSKHNDVSVGKLWDSSKHNDASVKVLWDSSRQGGGDASINDIKINDDVTSTQSIVNTATKIATLNLKTINHNSLFGSGNIDISGGGGGGGVQDVYVNEQSVVQSDNIAHIPQIPTMLNQLVSDSTHKTVTDVSITAWDKSITDISEVSTRLDNVSTRLDASVTDINSSINNIRTRIYGPEGIEEQLSVINSSILNIKTLDTIQNTSIHYLWDSSLSVGSDIKYPSFVWINEESGISPLKAKTIIARSIEYTCDYRTIEGGKYFSLEDPIYFHNGLDGRGGHGEISNDIYINRSDVSGFNEGNYEIEDDWARNISNASIGETVYLIGNVEHVKDANNRDVRAFLVSNDLTTRPTSWYKAYIPIGTITSISGPGGPSIYFIGGYVGNRIFTITKENNANRKLIPYSEIDNIKNIFQVIDGSTGNKLFIFDNVVFNKTHINYYLTESSAVNNPLIFSPSVFEPLTKYMDSVEIYIYGQNESNIVHTINISYESFEHYYNHDIPFDVIFIPQSISGNHVIDANGCFSITLKYSSDYEGKTFLHITDFFSDGD